MLFRRTKTEHLDDCVWATAKLKLDGICREIAEASGRYSMIITAAHDEKTLEKLKARFAGAGIRFLFWDTLPSVSDFDFARLAGGGTQTILVPSRLASEARKIAPLLRLGNLFGRADDDLRLFFIVAERAMLHAQDRELSTFAESLPWRATVRFHVSMEDPLLHDATVPDRIVALMKSLGWDEKGSFSHPSVTDLITVAQKYQKTGASAEKRSTALIGARTRSRKTP
ncbi:MAG TPA: hypothetical protein VFG28_15535 [Syntrophales bacterium]|nr:hypothetical protein [Syntrophales bacterium]